MIEKVYSQTAQKDINRHLDKAKAFSVYLYKTRSNNLFQKINSLQPESGEPLSSFIGRYASQYHIEPIYRIALENPFVIYFKGGEDEIIIIHVFNNHDEEDKDWLEKIIELREWE